MELADLVPGFKVVEEGGVVRLAEVRIPRLRLSGAVRCRQNKAFILALSTVARGAGEAAQFPARRARDRRAWRRAVLVRHHYLSLDPYMRGRMNDGRSYAQPQPLGEATIGGTVGEVVASRNPRFAVGDRVVGTGGWQLYGLSDGKGLRKIEPGTPIQAWLGPVGMPGVTAWYGVTQIIAPKAGETVLVSAATGAVGSVVGQLGETGGGAGGRHRRRPENAPSPSATILASDACVDHRDVDFPARLKKRCLMASTACSRMSAANRFVRRCWRHQSVLAHRASAGLVVIGADGTPTPLPDVRACLLNTRSRLEGFIVSDHLSAVAAQALSELAGHVAAGRLRWRDRGRRAARLRRRRFAPWRC